jgi:hypothetical protein
MEKGNMSKRELITKDFALYVVHYFASMQTWSKEDILAEIDRKIKEAKEDVVRCKDCKHWRHETEERIEHYECNIFSGAYGRGYPTNADDFCGYGERKEV